MGTLRRLEPAVRPLDDRVRKLDQNHEEARRALPWRGWYKLARWRRLRWQCLVRDLFTCQMCGHIEPDTSQLVADHKDPHRGDPRLFWDFENLQCLCKGCHDTTKQRSEARRG